MNDSQVHELARSIGEFITTIKSGTDAEAFEALTRTDLTLTQLRVVMVLMEADGPQSISDIAERLQLSLATAGRAVDHLVQQDFARRWEDPDNRRSKLVRLTDAGVQLAEAPRAAVEDRIRSFAESLPPGVATALLAALRQALDTAIPPPSDAAAGCWPATAAPAS